MVELGPRRAGKRTPSEWAASIRARIPPEGEVSDRLIRWVDFALHEHPRSTELWLLRANLIQISAEGSFPLLEALRSLERALEIDSDCAEAHCELGYWFDTVDEQLERARIHFERAIELEGSFEAHYGLARVLSQLGLREAALEILQGYVGSSEEREELRELADEIESGLWHPQVANEGGGDV